MHTRGGCSNIKVVHMCRTGFKNGGLREWPLTENWGGGFQSCPTPAKTGFGAKNNKERHILFKRRVFLRGSGRKSGLWEWPSKKIGGFPATHTVLSYYGRSPLHPSRAHTTKQGKESIIINWGK